MNELLGLFLVSFVLHLIEALWIYDITKRLRKLQSAQ